MLGMGKTLPFDNAKIKEAPVTGTPHYWDNMFTSIILDLIKFYVEIATSSLTTT